MQAHHPAVARQVAALLGPESNRDHESSHDSVPDFPRFRRALLGGGADSGFAGGKEGDAADAAGPTDGESEGTGGAVLDLCYNRGRFLGGCGSGEHVSAEIPVFGG